MKYLIAAEYCSCWFLAGSAPLLSHFLVVLIICCVTSVEYLLHIQFYKVALLQHLIVAEYYTYSFPADFIPIPSYYISVLIKLILYLNLATIYQCLLS